MASDESTIVWRVQRGQRYLVGICDELKLTLQAGDMPELVEAAHKAAEMVHDDADDYTAEDAEAAIAFLRLVEIGGASSPDWLADEHSEIMLRLKRRA